MRPMGKSAARGKNALAPTGELESTKSRLRRLIEENAGVPAAVIQDDSTIDGDLAMDSMSFVSLQVAVEEEFGILCAPAEIEAANHFETIAELIHERASKARRAGKARARPKAGTISRRPRRGVSAGKPAPKRRR